MNTRGLREPVCNLVTMLCVLPIGSGRGKVIWKSVIGIVCGASVGMLGRSFVDVVGECDVAQGIPDTMGDGLR